MHKQKLFDEDSEEEVKLKTENEYAKKYDKWREKEELHKLEQKYGSKALNSDASLSSDSEDESDGPPEVSVEVEAQFLKTLALLKTKDPRIYDPNYTFFDENEKKEQEKENKTKKLTFADSDDDDDDNDGNIFSIEKKAEIIDDAKDAKPSSENKEAKLKDYLIGKAEHIDNKVEKDLAPLKALWSDPKLNEGEAFLRDYILNKRYLEDGDIGEAEGDKIRDDEDLEVDEELVEQQGKFERAYNFRFEEPDQEYLKRFPRTMNYIRPKDERRSRKRAELRARKEDEKRRKMEDIARLKALKLKEIQEKIAKIKEVTGNEDLAFKEDDLNSDFDPEEHDRRMKEIFDEEYYGEADTEKPVFPELDEELEIENWENYEPEYEEESGAAQDGPHCEDEDFNMDADYDPKKARENLLEELKRSQGKKRRNRKKKSKLAELLSTEKPKFVPTVAEKTYKEYMEEYYKMDCEDVIGGDLPTRFKYREVVPNDYGLTVEEILLADDRELTQWVPLKKILKHRPDNVEKGEAKTYAQKAADLRLKKKVLPSLFKDLPEEPEIVVPIEEATTKKKKKKKKNKNKESNEVQATDTEHNDETIPDTTETPVDVGNSAEEEITQEDSQMPNGEVRKKKKKKKQSNNFIVESVQSTESSHENVQKDAESEANKSVDQNLEINPENGVANKVKRKKKNKIDNQNPNSNVNLEKASNNLKRKANLDIEQPTKKKKKVNNDLRTTNKNKKNKNMKFKQKDKFKKKGDKEYNPFSSLSDERLKAYGLNPKKYKKFMKYKKF